MKKRFVAHKFTKGWEVGQAHSKKMKTTKSVDKAIQYDSAEWEPAFQRQAREFLFFPLLPREARANKRVPIFYRLGGTG